MYFFIFILFVINSFWPRAQRIQFKKRKQLHAYKQAIDLPDSLQASLPEADRHDTSSIYRKLTLRELQREVPQIHWRLYLQEFLSSPITNDEHVVAYAIPYFVQMGRIVEKTDRRYKLLLFKIIRQIIKFVELINVINFFFFYRTLHNYILWRLVMSIMPHMIDDYQQKRVEYGKILLGILSERSRWSQCVEWTNKKLGMAVGALFIRDNFNHDSKVSEATIFINSAFKNVDTGQSIQPVHEH